MLCIVGYHAAPQKKPLGRNISIKAFQPPGRQVLIQKTQRIASRCTENATFYGVFDVVYGRAPSSGFTTADIRASTKDRASAFFEISIPFRPVFYTARYTGVVTKLKFHCINISDFPAKINFKITR